jgi:hypothetical protein
MTSPVERESFVVRVGNDPHGRLGGVVERVRNGQKERFEDLESLGRVIARMRRGPGHDTRD